MYGLKCCSKGNSIFKPTEVPADRLKATQSELVADKVIGMMNTLENDPTNASLTAPIYVSSCRAMMTGPLGELLEKMRVLSGAKGIEE